MPAIPSDPSLALAPRLLDTPLQALADQLAPTQRDLFIFGLGYTGQYLARGLVAAGWRVGGTSRGPDTRQRLQNAGIEAFDFDTLHGEDMAGFSHILTTIGPGRTADHDPVLTAHRRLLTAIKPRWVGYYSATSVYGPAMDDQWVDEQTVPQPSTDRGIRRLAIEQEWAQWAHDHGVTLSRFRIAGIYGPGRSIIEQLAKGTARVVEKPGHVFNRVHVEDIARATLFRMIDPSGPTLDNLADGEPMSQVAWTQKAAEQMGIEPPAAIPFDRAVSEMSPMGRSFWQDSKRIKAPAFAAAPHDPAGMP
ncbi:MAG: NAD-dependent epimerase/dehydratase family protein [Pseudomonadota bacterium]